MKAATILRMTTPIGREAQRTNPALEPLTPLLGEWRTTATHPLVPGTTFHGRTSFAWHQGGAFVLMRSEIDEPEVPSGVAVIGSDDAAGAAPDRAGRRERGRAGAEQARGAQERTPVEVGGFRRDVGGGDAVEEGAHAG